MEGQPGPFNFTAGDCSCQHPLSLSCSQLFFCKMHLPRAALPSSPSLPQGFLLLTPLCPLFLFPTSMAAASVQLPNFILDTKSELFNYFSCLQLFFLKRTLKFFLYWCVLGHVAHTMTYVELRSQLIRVSSLTLPCRSSASNSALSSGLVSNTFSHWAISLYMSFWP